MSSATCYIEKFYKDPTSEKVVSDKFYLSEVQAIEDVISVDLSETPIIAYPADRRFIIDLGTSRKFNVDIIRPNPQPYDDTSSDQSQWSNGHWYNELRHFLDEWQNFNLDSEGNMAGGYLFSYVVPKDAEDLYPSILSTRVLVSGSIQPSFSVGKLHLTIPFQVANKASDGELGKEISITLKSGYSEAPDVIMKAYANVIFRAPEVPAPWAESLKDKTFENWSLTEGQLGTIYPGDIISFSEDTVLYAYWNNVLGRAWMDFITNDVDTPGIDISYGGEHGAWIVKPPAGCTRIKAYVLGAGGGAGAWTSRIIGTINPISTIFLGSGGGSGELKIKSFNVFPKESVRVFVGEGGAGGTSSGDKNGKSGKSSKVVAESTQIESAGGFGGRGGSKAGVAGGAKGGSYGGSGGASGREEEGRTLTNGSDGEGGESPGSGTEILGFPGKGSPAIIFDKANKNCGGGGGGANGLVYNFEDGPESVIFRSRGGDSINQAIGTKYNPPIIDSSNGQIGGGGGAVSGDIECMAKGGKGGNGLVIMEFS